MICLAGTLPVRIRKHSSNDGNVPTQTGEFRSIRRTRARPSLVEPRNKARIQFCFNEYFVAHNLAKERQRCLDAPDCVFIQRPPHSIDRFWASASPGG